MHQSFLRGKPAIWVDDHELAEEVNHFGKGLTVTVLHELVDEVDLLYLNVVIRREWLLTCAEEVHDTSQRPAVYLKVVV